MLELLQITHDVELARLCDQLGGFRLFIDWETLGKAERQSGRNTFISTHTVEDLTRIRAAVTRSPVMVRVNPLWAESEREIHEALSRGADRLMLPMFRTAGELAEFARMVGGRIPITALLEHVDAANCILEWAGTPGVDEIFIGLNDLHLSLGQRFMYEPLANGMVDALVGTIVSAGKKFGFGGIARMDEGALAGRRVLGEHLRLGSHAVILSRTFHRFDVAGDSMASMASEVAHLRRAERELALRSPGDVEMDRLVAIDEINQIVAGLKVGA